MLLDHTFPVLFKMYFLQNLIYIVTSDIEKLSL